MLASKALAAAVSQEPVYVEDVFSTYLYTGTGSTQTITNGIDLAGEGGMVWFKGRSAAFGNYLFDTNRGALKYISTNTVNAEATSANSLTSFNSTGFTLGSSSIPNNSGTTFASWSFRKAEKFFDVVTYVGDGTSSRAISHNLGSTPGFILVKSYSFGFDWNGYHRILGATKSITINSTNAAYSSSTAWANTEPTSSAFYVGSDANANSNGQTYVAYLFAHNAGGFGLSGTDNVISCGSFTTDGSGNATVTLGYEPQYLLFKRSDSTGNWFLLDTMRGFTASASNRNLYPNLSDAEAAGGAFYLTSTGFGTVSTAASATFIYIAIRRGPMKVPTSGTSVYNAQTPTPTGIDNRKYTGVGFPLDAIFLTHRTGGGFGTWIEDRLRGAKKPLYAYSTTAEDGFGQGSTQGPASFDQDGWTGGSGDSGQWDYNVGYTNVFHYFRRAPGFMDVVCYTGDLTTNRQIAHRLGVTPELVIIKVRNGTDPWIVLWGGDTTKNLRLNTNAASAGPAYINGVGVSYFQVANNSSEVNNAFNYVAYLFATLAGVSKVGSYTGTATTLQIDCGFSAGARFVLIKRTDSTGDWYVWDSARGIVASTDPYLVLNSTAAEVTTTDWVDTYSAGFELSSAAGNNVNINAASYIFLSIS